MITATVLSRAAVIAASMAIALGALDIVHERWTHRGVRFALDFVVLYGFILGLEYLLGGTSAVVGILAH